MTDYVLEILDGDSAGDIFELTGATTSIGRRSSNDIVLNDEKVSGRHAEVVQEEDHFLLKDLGSTNGTLMDGRPITEVVLSPNDIVRVGRLRVAFKEKGAPTPGGEDMRVRRVDAETLAKTRRRGAGIGLLLILVVVLLGFGIWYMRSDISDGGVPNPMAIPDVAGNLLPRGVASVEGDGGEEGWTTAVSGLEFEIGGGAHTGRSALHVAYAISEAANGGAAPSEPRHHAIARTTKALNIVGGQSVKVRGFLWTRGGAKAALRLRFTSSAADDDLTITAGLKPASYDGYTEVNAELAVPPDLDRVQLEVLALLPDEDSEVLADDFVLSHGGAAKPHEFRTGNGFRLVGSEGGVAVRSPTASVVMHGVVPLVDDPVLLGLERDGLLVLSDAGADLKVTGSTTGSAKGYAFEVVGAKGVRVDFSADAGATGVLARKGNAPFASYDDNIRVDDVDNLLLGFGDSRMWIILPTSGPVRGESKGGRYRLSLPGATSFHVVTSFDDEARHARGAVTAARHMRRQGDYEAALTKLAEVLEQCPHDDQAASKARQLRAELRDEQNAWVDRLQEALDDARFFGTRGGFVAVGRELAALHDKFGAAHLTQKERFEKMQQDVRDHLQQLDQQRGERERGHLEVLVAVFDANGQKQLKELVQKYMDQHLPPPKKEGTEKEGTEAEGAEKQDTEKKDTEKKDPVKEDTAKEDTAQDQPAGKEGK
ncbi:MAG: FHA domain-containing protein [Planctomycetota bacterium]|jgi:hypothetical protein